MSENLLENLNEEQLKAVTFGEGPLMIIAGAGTGKTTVITQRIAWLIEQGRVKPDGVLALTFTEKAATEMEERVDRLLPIGYVDLWISTFHAFCERVLRDHSIEIGLPYEFKLLTEVDALLMIRRNFDRFNLDYYRPRGNPTKFVKALMSHFSRLKDETITPEEYLEHAQGLKLDDDVAEDIATENSRVLELANAYHTYQQILLENGALDFGDLIAYTIELLRKRPNIQKKYQEQFKYMLVDEFQDTNFAQYELVKLLAGKTPNLTVVGDDDQSIYKFRGASLSNILRFREDFPTAQKIVLNKNYRSAPEILSHAHQSIQKNNPNRLEVRENLDKRLQAQTDAAGVVEHHHLKTEGDEVKKTLELILELQQRNQAAWSDFCILVRANDSAQPFTSSLDKAGIPYRFLAMSGLYTKPIIVDALAYMRAIDQENDSPSMYRIVSHRTLGLTEPDIAQLTLHCRKKSSSLSQAMKSSAAIFQISPEGQNRIREILDSLSSLATSAKRLPVSELFLEVIKATGLQGDVLQMTEFDQQEQFGYLQKFFERLKKFEASQDDPTLHHFLAEFEHERDAGEAGALATDPELGPDVVNVMTVHASKGLEFPYVFIVNLVEQRFPSQRRGEPIEIPLELVKDRAEGDASNHHLEEERRLFYVAMTRAKRGLFLMSAEDYGGTRKRKISRFVKELEELQQQTASQAQAEIKQETQTINKKPTAAQFTPPKKVSFTQIAAFSTCPLQYKFAHVLKVPVFGRHSLSFGKTMHNTLQKFMELILHQQELPQTSLFDQPAEVKIPEKSVLMKLLEESWIDEWYPSEAIREEYHQKAKESLSGFYEEIRTQTPRVAFLEKGFTLKISEVTVKGRIDRADHCEDGIEIIDYKTGKPKEKLSWDDRKQLVLYQLAAESCFEPPLKIKKLTYHYLEDNSRVSFEAKEKEKDKLEAEILATVDAIKSSDFKPTPGFHCQYCDFKDICEFSEA